MVSRVVGLIVAAAVGVALCASTAARVRVWGDERLLWSDAVRKAPEKPRPWNNLGTQYELTGLVMLAENAYAQASALATNPYRLRNERTYGRALAEGNLARLQANRGDMRGAYERLKTVTMQYPVTSVMSLQRWYAQQLATP